MIATADLFRDQRLRGVLPAAVAGIRRDSRTVQPGEAFVAQGRPGERPRHVAEAIARGAALVVLPAGDPAPAGAATAWTEDPRRCFARACAALHGSDRLPFPVLAATGTKGKTTVVHWTWWCLGEGAARVGTVGLHDGRGEIANPQTTPAPEVVHAFLGGLPAACPGAAIEASSHAGDQHRLAGIPFRALAVTGMGRDHLDYHGTFERYLASKVAFTAHLGAGSLCVVNAGCPHREAFAAPARAAGARVVALGAAGDAVLAGARGAWTLDGETLAVPLAGGFNAWNAAAAVLLAEAAGVPRATALARLRQAPPPPGRLERLAEGPATYIDYAHTPESIAAAIQALREAHPGAPLAIVFGCGGDRDPGKRTPMGAAAAAADVVVITTDNSRSEAPAAISAMIRIGLRGHPRTIEEPERGAAILAARAAVGAAGVVLGAGKGHETTQDIQGTVRPWDDRAFVRALGARP
ncbi:MAG: UDP-N-acetylmuramyl-tripeptide synthetase family protein [Planctomycetota bacterium]